MWYLWIAGAFATGFGPNELQNLCAPLKEDRPAYRSCIEVTLEYQAGVEARASALTERENADRRGRLSLFSSIALGVFALLLVAASILATAASRAHGAKDTLSSLLSAVEGMAATVNAAVNSPNTRAADQLLRDSAGKPDLLEKLLSTINLANQRVADLETIERAIGSLAARAQALRAWPEPPQSTSAAKWCVIGGGFAFVLAMVAAYFAAAP